MISKETSCFFTGHRILPAKSIPKIKDMIRKTVTDLYSKGVTVFISGGAIGFDLLATQTILQMKSNGYPNLALYMFIPCINHTDKWSNLQKLRFFYIRSRSDKIIYTSRKQYTNSCMLKRNILMANSAKYCIAYLKNHSSGTGYTVRYAQKNNNSIINIADCI